MFKRKASKRLFFINTLFRKGMCFPVITTGQREMFLSSAPAGGTFPVSFKSAYGTAS
jgi:hypothetical protein